MNGNVSEIYILCHKIASLDLQYFTFWYLINLYQRRIQDFS